MALEYVLNIKDNGSVTLNKVNQSVNVLQKNLISVDNSTNIFSKSLSTMQTAFSGWATAAVSKAGAALKDFAKEMIDSYDSAAKLSDNIGVTAESIIGLRYAADLSSVGSENMDKNMAKLAQTISKAANGSKDAANTFAKMGIEVKNSDGTLKNSEQVLMEMADAFQNLPAGTERATLAMDVFGKSGASMVTMLKDGSGALREMVNEGAGAAGNIGNISEAMSKFNDVGVKAKTAITGFMAGLTDSEAFKAFISGVEGASQALSKFNKERAKSKEKEKTEDLKELTDATRDYQMKLKEVEKQEAKAAAAGPDKRSLLEKIVGDGSEADKLKKMKKELESLENKKFKISYDMTGTIDAISEAEARLKGLEEARSKIGGYKKQSTEQWEIDSLKEYIEGLKNESAENENVKKSTAVAIAGYEEKQKAMEDASKAAAKAAEEARRLNEQRIKEEAKEFDDLMKNKEDAIKKLADFEEKMRIASLDGEERKLAQAMANCEKQKAELEAMHELELMFAEDEFEVLANQGVRILELERQKNIEIDAIKQEFADKELERIKKEDDAKLSSSSASMQAMQQITDGYKSYAGLYKASQIGEATINAVQSVLKTMSSTPYPFNIPLASLQTAAAAVQVRKIAGTKMYAGGMIPGRNTLIRANEEGREAILTTRGVRNAGGPAGVDALNSGSQNIRNSYDNRKSNVTVNMYPVMVTPQTWREKVEPVAKWSEQRW
jgi:hypothetical protein